MATLEKIRNKAGLLVIVVGFALFAFIIGDFLRSGSTFFRQSQEKVAIIDGEAVGIRDFQKKVSEMEEVYKMQSNVTSINEEITSQIRESVFQTMVREVLIDKESGKVGFTVGKEELADMVMGNNISPMIQQMPMFKNQQGMFDKNALMQFLKVIESEDLDGQPEEYRQQVLSAKKFWLFWEQNIKTQRMEEKFSSLLSKAIVSNTIDAKAEYDASKVETSFDYVLKSYASIADDQVTVSGDEIKKLYDKRKELFKQENAQVVSYIAVPIYPSQEDFDKIRNLLTELKPKLMSGSISDITGLVNDNSDVPFTDAFLTLQEVRGDARVFVRDSTIGAIDGPIMIGTLYSMTKLIDKKTDSDSIKFSQIRIPAPDEETAKEMADSLMTVIGTGKTLAEIAREMSGGQSDGDMGWVTEYGLLKGSDEKFKDEIWNAPLNKPVIVKSNYGTHVICVTEKTAPVAKYKVADIQVRVTPSTETYKKLYGDLSRYVAKYTQLDSFQSAATANNYICNTKVVVGQNDQVLGNVAKSRPVIRWAFEHKKGEISDIIECDNNFIVAGVEGSLKKGYRPLADVSDMLKRELLDDKKAEKIIADAKSKNISSLVQYSQEFGTSIQNIKFVAFGTPNISGIGKEPILNAMSAVLEKGKISEPLKGKAGVFVINVIDKKNNEGEFNAKTQKQSLDAMNGYRISYQALNKLREQADVEDHRIRFY